MVYNTATQQDGETVRQPYHTKIPAEGMVKHLHRGGTPWQLCRVGRWGVNGGEVLANTFAGASSTDLVDGPAGLALGQAK